VRLKALPLTPNGKVDRRALAAHSIKPELEGIFVAPRTSIEEKIAEIWAQVLELEQVGIYDNFFELGGFDPQHSDYRQSQPSWFTGYTQAAV